MRTIRRRYRFGSLGAAVILLFSLSALTVAAAPPALAGSASDSLTASPTSAVTLVGNHSTIPAGAVALGDVPAGQQLHLVVGLRLRNSGALRQFVAKLRSTPVPGRVYLTSTDVINRYAPTKDQYQTVQDYLTGIGCTIDRTYTNRFIVDATCSANQVHASLGIQIRSYRDAAGHEFYANRSDPRVPTSVGSLIQSIGGLNNLPVFRSHVRMPTRASVQDYSGGYSPQNILTAYDANSIRSQADGTGQTIAILTAYGYNQSDISSFDQQFSLPDPQLNDVPIDGSISQTTPETPLDVEWSHAMAPGAKIVVYEASDTTSSVFTDMYNRALSDNLAQVWSTSWGACEDQQPSIYTDQSIFAAAAAEGISIYAASGDAGGTDCGTSRNPAVGVDYPASDPSVTGVGGTTLTLNSDGSIESETAWTGSGTAGGSGGGVSDIFSQPSWQSAVASYPGRAVPDVAFDADPNTGLAVVINGSAEVIGGTSDAAPSWAGLTAMLNQYGSASIGYANPLYYQANVRSTFHDITQGNNGVYYAGPGYDPVTGLGSPDVGALAQTIFAKTLPTATPTPIPTATPLPPPLVNGGFETGDLTGWQVCASPPAPYVTSAASHSGSYSVFLGSNSSSSFGDSAICQSVSVSAQDDALGFYYVGSTSGTIANDWQEVDVIDAGGAIHPLWQVSNNTNGQWTPVNLSLAQFDGQNVTLRFLVHEGDGNPTSMFVDDVTLGASPFIGQASVSVGVDPQGDPGIDSSRGLVYVANSGSNSLSVINEASRSVIATVPVGQDPYAAVVDSGLDRVFVSNTAGGTVSAIDGSSDALLSTINIGGSPTIMAIDTVNHRLYVANGGSVSLIDTQTLQFLQTFSNVCSSGNITGLAVDPGLLRLFASCGSSNSLSTVDVTSGSIASQNIGSQPEEVAVDPSTHMVYVALHQANAVAVVNGSTGATVGQSIPVGQGPWGVAVNPTSHQVYVTNETDHTVTTIEGTSNAATLTSQAGASPTGVGVDASLNAVWVTDGLADRVIELIPAQRVFLPVVLNVTSGW